MKRVTVFFILLFILLYAASAQEASKKFEFKPVATAMMSLYGEFPENATKYGFNLDRSYLGVEAKYGGEWSFKFVVDCGKSSSVDDYERIIYIKNAMVQWKRNAWSLRLGLIGTNVFNAQEKFWGKRYVMKSFQDEYKFGSSADLGIAAEWAPSKVISVDAIIVNGEGYKKLQVEKGFLYGLGVTVKPVEGLTLRLYGDLNQRPDNGTPQKTLNVMAGYRHKRFSIAAEGNFSFDQSGTKEKNLSGLSAYASVKAGRCDIFARYDYLTSRNDWNKDKDGNLALLGVEIPVFKWFRIAPNARLWFPSSDAKTKPSAHVSLQFAL